MNVEVDLQQDDSIVWLSQQATPSIFRTDTFIESGTGFFHIRYFDSSGHLWRKIVTNPYESSSGKIFTDVESCNADGRLVEETKFSRLLPWHHYKYKWGSQGRLIEKYGFGSGDSGSKELYMYENGLKIRHRISGGRDVVDTVK